MKLTKPAGELLFSVKLLHSFTWIEANNSVHSKMIINSVNILSKTF